MSMNTRICPLWVIVCALTAALFPCSLPLQTFQCPSDECRTISLAMLKAKAGDSVIVAKGTYHDHVVVGEGVVLYASPLTRSPSRPRAGARA